MNGNSVGVRILAVIGAITLIGGVSYFATRAISGSTDEEESAQTVADSARSSMATAAETELVPTISPVSIGDADGELDENGEPVVAVDASFEGEGPDNATPVVVDEEDFTPSEQVAVSEAPTAEFTEVPMLTERFELPDAMATPAAPEGPTVSASSEDDPGESDETPPATGPAGTDAPFEAEGDPEAVITDPESPELGEPVFIDPCASTEPSEPAPDDCPDDGEPGTILGDGFAIEGVPPMWVVGYSNPLPPRPEESFITQCAPQDLPETSVPFGITTPNPAAMTLSWWVEGIDGINEQELVTSDADRARWQRRIEGGRDPATVTVQDYIQHCTAIPDLLPGQRVHFEIVAVDDALQVATASDSMAVRSFIAFPPPPEAGVPTPRPPVRIVGGRSNELIITAPARAGHTVRFLAYPHEGAGPFEDPCERPVTTEQPGYGAPVVQVARNVSEIPAERRNADGYPYLRNYSEIWWDGLRLDSGAEYRVCIEWTKSDAPSFDQGVDELEAYEVATPNLRTVQLEIERINTRRPIPEGRLAIRARPGARPLLVGVGCVPGQWNSNTELDGDLQFYSVVEPIRPQLCRANPAMSDLLTDGILIDTTVYGDDGTEFTRTVRVRPEIECAETCAPLLSERYNVDLPLDDGERPRSFGFVQFKLYYGENSDSLAREFVIGPPEPLGDQRVEREGPQLDIALENTQIGSVEVPGRRFEVVADRPVTVTASLQPYDRGAMPGYEDEYEAPVLCTQDEIVPDPEGAPDPFDPSGGGVPALVEPVTEVTSDEFAERHIIEFGGLCPDERYNIELRLTDEDGDTTSWGAPREPGFIGIARGGFRTDPIFLAAAINMEIGVLPNPGGAFVHDATVLINGDYANWPFTITGCHPGWRSINSYPTGVETGLTVRIRARVSVEGHRGGFGSDYSCITGDDRFSVELLTEIPLEEALAAEEIVLESSDDDDFPLRVTISFERRYGGRR